MNTKSLKIIKKWANLQIPGSKVYQDLCIDLFEQLPLKMRSQCLKEFKIHLNKFLN